jgi:hypothetical protein
MDSHKIVRNLRCQFAAESKWPARKGIHGDIWFARATETMQRRTRRTGMTSAKRSSGSSRWRKSSCK